MRRSLPVVMTWLALAGVPALALAWLLTNRHQDATVMVPDGHFYIVSVTALLSAALALVTAIASVRLANVRTLLLALAFLSMAGMFAVHGLSTPGFLVGPEYSAVVGFSARMSLVLAAGFLAASAATWPVRLERAVCRARVAILALAAVGLLAYAAAGLRFPQSIPPRIVSEELFLRGTLAMVLALSFFAAVRYFNGYRRSGLTMYGSVALGAVLLFEAQVAMHFGQVWHSSWWLYHAMLFAAFVAMTWGLAIEYVRGNSPLLAIEGLSLRDPVAQIRAGYTEVVCALAAALEARDGYTHGHGQRVAALAVLIGEQLGLAPGRLRALAQGALLHDVGKIAVPDRILNKPGPLTSTEFDQIKCHPARGAVLLTAAFTGAVERAVIRHHHERFDGSGYPDGLAGKGIPLEARIAAVADVYDALRSSRSYRTAWERERTLEYMREQASTHFDPHCLEAFFAVAHRWEAQFSADAELRPEPVSVAA